MVDRYTKAILTVIASCLVLLVLRGHAAAQLSQLTSDNWVRPEFGLVPRTIWP
jgi:hypothetical protein